MKYEQIDVHKTQTNNEIQGSPEHDQYQLSQKQLFLHTERLMAIDGDDDDDDDDDDETMCNTKQIHTTNR